LRLLGLKNVLPFLRERNQVDALFRLLEERALSDETIAIRILSLGGIVFIKDSDATFSYYENICGHVSTIIEKFQDSIKVRTLYNLPIPAPECDFWKQKIFAINS